MIETKNRRSGQRELITVDRAVDVIASILPTRGSDAGALDPNL